MKKKEAQDESTCRDTQPLMLMTLLLAHAGAGETQKHEETVEIPDFALRRVIAVQLEKPYDAIITTADMAKLTFLLAPHQRIKDLTGLEFATELTDIDLGENQITDLSPLRPLLNVNRLNISGNPLSDAALMPLAQSIQLESLDISEAGISDLSVLSGLTNLVHLKLGHNEISDLTSLAGLTRLEMLELDQNRIWDLSPLSGLVNLKMLELSDNYISDLFPLAELTNLEVLRLKGNKISDVSPLTELSKLSELTLVANRIHDVTPLANLKQLESLALGENFVTDVSPLGSLTELTDFHLYLNHVTYLSPFLKSKNLKEIDARANPLSLEIIIRHIPLLEKRGIEISYGQSDKNKAEREARRKLKKLHSEIHGLSTGIYD